MKKIKLILVFAIFSTLIFTSCREQAKEEEISETETLIQEMREEGADIEVKSDDGESKIKMETENKEVKIKTDEDGDSKVKVDVDD
ncbi:MAG: hypothetical protein CL526_03460 [Aequorivita sp.]|nr:hypothetical protein [Aequorivita sp.]|tara:strand:- start:68422 stop:68679 length:258 start_codon:yes stop_codon:yes gene_type:complete